MLNNRDLGPLPKSDRNSELQRLSFRALGSILPVGKFIPRDERYEDYGVDLSLELIVDSRPTNLRSQVQLKSAESRPLNQDGSISLSVAASNLNYLLNGLSSLYILYVASSDELRFAWAHDERKRLDKENPEWMQQDTITLRFRELLTPDALNQIHTRVLQEGRLHRKIGDTLSQASLHEQIAINIDAKSLEIIDLDERKETLLNSGMTIVASGYPSLVISAIQSLNASDRQLPRVLIVEAYAYFSVGNYQQTLACVGNALLHHSELSSSDKQFLKDIRDACHFETGQIGYPQYADLLEQALTQNDDELSSVRKLTSLRLAFREAAHPENRRKLLSEIRSTVDDIFSATSLSDNFKLDARIILLEAEGRQLVVENNEILHQIRIRQSLGTIGLAAALETLQERTDNSVQWNRSITEAANEAQKRNHPLLVGA